MSNLNTTPKDPQTFFTEDIDAFIQQNLPNKQEPQKNLISPEKLHWGPLSKAITELFNNLYENTNRETKNQIEELAEKYWSVMVYSEIERQIGIITDKEYEKINKAYTILVKKFKSFVSQKHLDTKANDYNLQIGEVIQSFFRENTIYKTDGDYGSTFKWLYELSKDWKYKLDCDMYCLLALDLAQEYDVDMVYNEYSGHANSTIGDKVFERTNWWTYDTETFQKKVYTKPLLKIHDDKNSAILLSTTTIRFAKDDFVKKLKFSLLQFIVLYDWDKKIEKKEMSVEKLWEIDLSLWNYFNELYKYANGVKIEEQTSPDDITNYLEIYDDYNRFLMKKWYTNQVWKVRILERYFTKIYNTIVDYYNLSNEDIDAKNTKKYKKLRNDGILSDTKKIQLFYSKFKNRYKKCETDPEYKQKLNPPKTFENIIKLIENTDKKFKYNE